MFLFGALIILLLDFIWTPFKGLTPELQALAIFYIIPEIFWDMHGIALLSMTIGFGLWLLRWRKGKLQLTDEKLTIEGSYFVSIWLQHMWEVEVRDFKHNRWRVRLDSNVNAVQLKFKTEKEFEDFSEKLVRLVGHVENIRLKTMTD